MSFFAAITFNFAYTFPVAFTASRASSRSQSTTGRIRFERTLTSVGAGWDENDSQFVCYHAGTYVFSWSAVGPRNSQFRVTLLKNSREYAHAWGEEDGYQSASNSVALELQRNDRVELRLAEGRLYEPSSSTRGYTTFTGYKLN